ncbi:MAG: hypothetical protein WCY33_02720 [Clostridia bacterium]|jgi:RecJ-like exonuclease
MKADTIIIECNSCGKTGPAWGHLGCDTSGFGGELVQCQCCGDVYYAQPNQMYYNSPCCSRCHEDYDNLSLRGMGLKKYEKAMGYRA